LAAVRRLATFSSQGEIIRTVVKESVSHREERKQNGDGEEHYPMIIFLSASTNRATSIHGSVYLEVLKDEIGFNVLRHCTFYRLFGHLLYKVIRTASKYAKVIIK